MGLLSISDSGDVVAFAVFAIAALTTAALARLARTRAVEAEQRRAEAGRALAELEALARERDRMQAEAIEAEALRRSDELKTALLRSVSHDLRTPLTSIIAAGSALGLARRLTTTERAELSAAIVDEGERLSRLVENLLDVSRLESGKAEPHREPVDLAEVLEVARGAVGPGAARSGSAVEPDLPLLRADPAQLERAFANLFENAIRHGTGARSWCARGVGRRLVVRVVDQGPGIPESEWERIFEPFYRGGNGARRSPARGSGLAIAKGFVEANGGEITVESLPGQGTSFVVDVAASSRGTGDVSEATRASWSATTSRRSCAPCG